MPRPTHQGIPEGDPKGEVIPLPGGPQGALPLHGMRSAGVARMSAARTRQGAQGMRTHAYQQSSDPEDQTKPSKQTVESSSLSFFVGCSPQAWWALNGSERLTMYPPPPPLRPGPNRIPRALYCSGSGRTSLCRMLCLLWLRLGLLASGHTSPMFFRRKPPIRICPTILNRDCPHCRGQGFHIVMDGPEDCRVCQGKGTRCCPCGMPEGQV
jgi:hypothetical protein